MIKHSDVTCENRTGFPNMIAQPEHAGIDYFGNEILAGDDVAEFDGEVILKDNLERFLEEIGFEFKTAI